ncbi:MAG: hypothetical protein K2N94_00810 [Lachnospiraceae bacterium]|nr:hypothetical protein [Lachnospiraceae bacterium]
MQTYEEALDFLDHIGKYGAHPGIENSARLLEALGHPERGLKIIHVAGTNGKGSVCAFLADMLTAQGYRTGLFISPHLVDIRERIQLDRELIGKDAFASCFRLVQEAAEALAQEGYTGITYFDYLFAAALCWYREQSPDYVVVETGLGGRMDSTNAVAAPVLTIITSISLDHTEILGDTIAKIAAEKAGIIKPGVPLIYCADEPDACEVIGQAADAAAAPRIGVGRRHCIQISPEPAKEEADDFRSSASSASGRLKFLFCLPAAECGAMGSGIREMLTVNSPALYQAENAAIAYTAALWLYLHSPEAPCPADTDSRTIPVPEQVRAALQRGLARSVWEGRFEEIFPNVYIDGAHNADGIRMLLASVRPVAAGHPVTLLFSAVKEKDTSEMIRELCESGLFCRYLVTTVGGVRAIAPEQLKEHFLAHTDATVMAYDSPQEAFAAALELTGMGGVLSGKISVKENSNIPFTRIIQAQPGNPDDGKAPDKPDEILLCAGSLYLVGIIKELLPASFKTIHSFR